MSMPETTETTPGIALDRGELVGRDLGHEPAQHLERLVGVAAERVDSGRDRRLASRARPGRARRPVGVAATAAGARPTNPTLRAIGTRTAQEPIGRDGRDRPRASGWLTTHLHTLERAERWVRHWLLAGPGDQVQAGGSTPVPRDPFCEVEAAFVPTNGDLEPQSAEILQEARIGEKAYQRLSAAADRDRGLGALRPFTSAGHGLGPSGSGARARSPRGTTVVRHGASERAHAHERARGGAGLEGCCWLVGVVVLVRVPGGRAADLVAARAERAERHRGARDRGRRAAVARLPADARLRVGPRRRALDRRDGLHDRLAGGRGPAADRGRPLAPVPARHRPASAQRQERSSRSDVARPWASCWSSARTSIATVAVPCCMRACTIGAPITARRTGRPGPSTPCGRRDAPRPSPGPDPLGLNGRSRGGATGVSSRAQPLGLPPEPRPPARRRRRRPSCSRGARRSRTTSRGRRVGPPRTSATSARTAFVTSDWPTVAIFRFASGPAG